MGNTVNDFTSYNINIQQGWPDTTLIMPSDLNLDTRQALILFDTGMGNQIPLKAILKNEDTDMIRLFTDHETLRNLVKRSPIAMDIQRDSDID